MKPGPLAGLKGIVQSQSIESPPQYVADAVQALLREETRQSMDHKMKDLKDELAAAEEDLTATRSILRTGQLACKDSEIHTHKKKIAELELRLELERVVRLERENELEAQRRQTLAEAESKLASQAKSQPAGTGAPGRAHQLALLG